ncbi:MAG TPA: nitrous oxide reductase, partial [Oceanithermus sp.]|nr:nitrous oxide reductase [Oceanithermus sp.]
MRRFLPLLLVLVALLAACRPKGPVPIEYGQDICAFCKMIIADPRYGAELITKKGKVYKFDSVECMVAFMMYDLKPEDVAAAYVTDFAHPGKLIPAEEAYYLQSTGLRSPMSLGITAFATK